MNKTKRKVIGILCMLVSLLIVPGFSCKSYAANSTDGTYYVSTWSQYASVTTTYLKDNFDNPHFETGDEVDLSNFTINTSDDYELDHWNVKTFSDDPVTINNDKFIMPNDDVSLQPIMKIKDGKLKLYKANSSGFAEGFVNDEVTYSEVKLKTNDDLIDLRLSYDISSIWIWDDSEAKYNATDSGWFTSMYPVRFEKGKKYFLVFVGSTGLIYDSISLNDESLTLLDDYPYNNLEEGYYVDSSSDIYVGLEVDLTEAEVTFNSNGGSGSIDPVTTTKYYTVPTNCDGLTVPEGMIFKGWSLSSTGEIVSGEIILQGDTELFAIWKPDTTVNFITSTTISAGTKIADVVFSSSNGLVDVASPIVWREQNGSSWPGVSGDTFESGKIYWGKITFSNVVEADNLVIGKVYLNGEEIPFSSGSVSAPNEGFTLQSTSQFTLYCCVDLPSLPSSSSKTYKATNEKKTVEKISGSGKKGSKRTITPIEGRKVSSVIVRDKNGNKVDVTLNADGTYSFIQPASDVTVEVVYKNREIKLTIGSTEASVDGENSNLDVSPVIRNDRTMLPIRFVAENLGAKVDWDEKDPNTVIITKGDIKIEITLGSDIAKVNGKDYKLDSVAFAENDRTYLPVRFVSENLNAVVEWNEARPMEVLIYEI